MDGTRSFPYIAVTIPIASVYVVFVVVTTFLYGYRCISRKDDYLEKRSIPLVLIQSIAGLVVGVLCVVIITLSKCPCLLRVWLLYLCIPIWLISIAFRGTQIVVAANCAKDSNKPASDLKKDINPTAGSKSDSACGTQLQLGHRMEQLKTLVSSPLSTSHVLIMESKPEVRESLSAQQDLWSEHEPFKNSTSSLPLHHNTCSMFLQRSRYSRMVTDSHMVALLAGIGTVLCVVALSTGILKRNEYSERSTNTLCPDDGVFWGAYGIIITVNGLVFPAIVLFIWKCHDLYWIRTDVIICIITSILSLIMALIWRTALARINIYVPEIVYAWLCVFVSHLSVIVYPLVKSSMARPPKPSAFPSIEQISYPNPRLRRSIFTSLYKEFYHILSDKEESRKFLAFAENYGCSELTGFLNDFQSLKLHTLCILRHAYFVTRNNGNAILLGNIWVHRPPEFPVGPIFLDNDPLAIQVAEYKTHKKGKRLEVSSPLPSNTKINSVLMPERRRSASKSIDFPNMTPLTAGILDTTILLLPPKAVTLNTKFPEAVKIEFSSIITRYFCKGSYMSENISGNLLHQIHDAVNSNNVLLSTLDRAKDEAIYLLCTESYVEYRRKYDGI